MAYPVSVQTHDGLRLVTTDERFFLVPLSSGSTEALEIDRLNFELKLIQKNDVPRNGPSMEICALIGIIHLLAGPYLIVATSKEKVGEIDGHLIFEIKGFDIIPFSKSTIHLSAVQVQDNQQYLAMVQRVLATPGFYLSYTYDLTHSLQRRQHLMQTKPKFVHSPLHERADERFVWNGHLLRDFVVQPELRRFLVPMIHGFVEVKACSIHGKPFTFVIVSRRSAQRAGVRYYMRGVDDEGHVANYVETEQLIMYHGYKASFVQTRGSVPLFWSQRPTLKYKPNPLIATTPKQATGIQRHFDEQIVHYGQQVVINLLDRKGPEKTLNDTFTHYVNSLSSCLIGYEPFDFHKECSKMRWHRLTILTDKLVPKQEEFGYFMMDANGAVVSVQQGVFRTNCIDCLDRTNVVQSMLASRSLLVQLQRLQVMAAGETFEGKKEFENIRKNIWADNADYLAKQYTGTGALKTDFTRTGRRTHLGLLKDGYNSAIRYYYNNFYDGFRQDAIDLFLGNHVVDRWEGVTEPSPLRIDRTWRFKVLPIILLIGFSMLFMSLLVPSTDFSLQLLYILFWSATVMGTLGFIYINGQEFTDSPKLVQTEDWSKKRS